MGNFPPSALRLPPRRPCHRRTDIAGVTDKRKRNADQMIVGNCLSVNGGHIRPYYKRRCKRKSLTNIESLSEDLLFEILVRLPAQDISKSVMFVCRKWYDTIHSDNFIYAHLEHAASGLLLHYRGRPQQLIFMAMKRGRIEISNQSYEATCGSSCNGLVWEYRHDDDHDALWTNNILVITNPATKQHFVLPPFHSEIRHHLCGIGYAASSMEYKVVMTYVANEGKSEEVWRSSILTIGFDHSWRGLSIEHLSPAVQKVLISTPLINEGFMHWAIDGTHVLTLNVETEIIRETSFRIPIYSPIRQGQVLNRYFYMSTGRHLSLLITCGKFLWDVWEMKSDIQEWTKRPSIDLEAKKCRFEQFGWKDEKILIPVGWLEYPKVLVFHTRGPACACIFYNLLTHEIELTQLPKSCADYDFLIHKNSLVWLDEKHML